MNKSFLFLLAAAMTLAACQKTEISAPSTEGATLSATIEDVASTKTYMDANNNICWSEGDQVVAFMKSSYGHKYQLKSGFAGKTYADFTLISGNSGDLSAGIEWEHNIVYYPYSESAEAEKAGSGYVLSVTLPAEQNYAAASFGNGSMAMVAVSENNNITFKNVLGGMKLQLKGTQKVASITLEGKNNEKLSGAAVVTAYAGETKPAITMSDGASTSVTLDCGSGVQLSESSATQFIIALPSVVFTKGFTVTITDTESNTYTVGTDKENEVLRSSLLVMPAVSIGSGQGSEPQEGDYIDEYGINHGQGIEIDGVVWAPVNCGYHETDFKYGKMYQWGRKYGQGYSDGLANSGSDQSYPDGDDLLSYPVDPSVGQSSKNGDKFYFMKDSPKDWSVMDYDDYWNLGDDSDPIKTEYDPCPDGWRVPTLEELSSLIKNKSEWTSDEKGQNGYWLYGQNSDYSESSPRVFLPAAGYHTAGIGELDRRSQGRYWSSSPRYWEGTDRMSYYIQLSSTNLYAHVTYRSNGYSVRCVQDDATLIPVENITLSKSSLTLSLGTSETLSTTITPSNANHQSAYWWSENPEVASVDQNGNITAVSTGTTTIYAMAGMQVATCEVTVTAGPQEGDYVDEYGVNHGQGVEIDGVVWAPVNCGYHKDDFKYGKLYQWGRKYGQGSDGDATVPTLSEGGVSELDGNHKSNANVFYYGFSDWADPGNDELWNSGTEENPVKTEYDPCPKSWRVPTSAELNELCSNRSSWTTDENGQVGYWFSGASSYTENVPQVFFPAAGYRNYGGSAYYRGSGGFYWSSSPNSSNAYYLYFNGSNFLMYSCNRAYGYSVRCVQE